MFHLFSCVIVIEHLERRDFTKETTGFSWKATLPWQWAENISETSVMFNGVTMKVMALFCFWGTHMPAFWAASSIPKWSGNILILLLILNVPQHSSNAYSQFLGTFYSCSGKICWRFYSFLDILKNIREVTFTLVKIPCSIATFDYQIFQLNGPSALSPRPLNGSGFLT